MRKLILGLTLVAAVGLNTRIARAQTSDEGTTSASVPATATLTIGSVLFIAIDNNNITFPNPTAADYVASYVDANETSTLVFGGNVTHDVEIEAGSGTFTPSAGATYNKPAEDFEYTTDGTNYTPIGGAADIVTANPPGAGNTAVNYRVALDPALDGPGTYSLGFSYTIVPN
jgi:hypothetical protein